MGNANAAGAVSLLDKQQLLTTDEGFVEFYSDFEQRLDDLKDALKNTRRTKELAASLQQKGAMKNFFGSFSGRNDKELAQMVEDLGASMETTQVILQLVLKVQNTKNRFLRDFHKALVEKVVLIENDTSTLDSNQRQAAVAIVSELRDQVATQIEQQAIVESHQKKLQALDGYLDRKDDLDQQQSEKISQLESRALEIIRTDEEQQRLIEGLHAAHASKDELDRIQTQRIDALMTAVSHAEMENEKHQRSIEFLQSQQDLMIEQLRHLEARQRAFTSTRALILRNLLPATALLAALAAMLLTLT